ncbi:DeoR/GlpR transcriptional regulator [Stutzerimonas nosocomialis]|uniref:DeoR/GlpR family DNA-binding transcription regulator n=1 Tax=Stutzerimonas nosocomialis TaxID=1056496 RepID=UPI0011089D8D|nr:DeoR/GlpR family DNA-binding transcription regulator [Stutzerimonas nosocomialis]TLX60992.1 DeoR/GlpR transcriptional regulator [Stutzerimonas nosocomialis]
MQIQDAPELPHLRRQKILLLLERDGKVMAADLSQRFGVSEDTIRRDLAELAGAGLLHRVHGGALPRSADTGKDFFTRAIEVSEAKQALACLAAQRVQDGQIVVFDSGTTTLQIALSLPAEIAITAVTHSPMIAMALARYSQVEIILAGGQLNTAAMVVTGHEAVRLFESVNADLLFTGLCALHPELGLTTAHFNEVAVKQAMLRGASQVVAVATADKLGAVEPFVVAPCHRVDVLITERHIPSGDIGVYRQQGIEVQQARA